ncbi:MAG TPA: NUDIX domain-containing protein [Gammaproteobacteria bacterium]|nr:NUDIX domain-containing protein [Gammaproteobacteria bacterium]
MDKKVSISKQQTIYDGYVKVEEYYFQHQLFAGGTSPQIRRELVERGEAVAVLAIDLDREKLIMIEQFRIGALAAGAYPWSLEIVAGIIEPGEPLESVAIRETLEETGCKIENLRFITDYLSTPGVSSERIHLYCGITDSRQVGGTHGVASEGEDIRVFTINFDDIAQMLKNPQACNGLTIIALQWLLLNRDNLSEFFFLSPPHPA